MTMRIFVAPMSIREKIAVLLDLLEQQKAAVRAKNWKEAMRLNDDLEVVVKLPLRIERADVTREY